MHCYIRSIHSKEGFKRLSESQLSNPAMFARLPAVDSELSNALGMLVSARGFPDLKARGMRVEENASSPNHSRSITKLLLAAPDGSQFILCTISEVKNGAESFKWELRSFADFRSIPPLGEGPRGSAPEIRKGKAYATTSRGALTVDYSSREVLFKDQKTGTSCRYEEAGPSFCIAYGTGRWTAISEYAQLPMAFQKAMEEAALSGRMATDFYRGFVDSLSVLLSGRVGQHPPARYQTSAQEKPSGRIYPGDIAKRQIIIDAFRKFGIEFDESDLQAAEEYLSNLNKGPG